MKDTIKDAMLKINQTPENVVKSEKKSQIKNEINWIPKYTFDDALIQTVNWYAENSSWWEPLIDEKTLHPQPWTLNWNN